MYADDIALVAESDQDLQQAFTIIDDTFIQWGMEISVSSNVWCCNLNVYGMSALAQTLARHGHHDA